MGYKYTRVKIKQGWEGAGRKGTALGEPVFAGQEWLPVLWDGEEDPALFKLAGIEVENE